MKCRCTGHAIVEWVLCVPILIALMSFVFGFLFLVLQQIQLEVLCERVADHVANIDLDPLLLESEALHFLRTHAHRDTTLVFDRHVVDEKQGLNGGTRPPIEIVGVELRQQPTHFSGLQLRATARSVRVR